MSFKPSALAPTKAGMANKKEILLESYLLNFKNSCSSNCYASSTHSWY